MALSVPAAAQTVALRAPARDFGYLVGDVIVTEAVITTRAENEIDGRSLPAPGPLNASIELRKVDMRETLANGTRQTVLHMEYQSFLAPDQVMQAELPAYDIRFRSSMAHVLAWPFHVSPLRVARRSIDDLADLRGNLAITPLPENSALAGLLASAGLALAAAIMFAGVQGWLPGFRRASRPFAMAARRIAGLAPPDTESAMRALLHAFDATDGRHVFAEDLDSFLLRHSSFLDLKGRIERFFDLSKRYFFSPKQGLTEPGRDFEAVATLAKALRRAERRW